MANQGQPIDGCIGGKLRFADVGKPVGKSRLLFATGSGGACGGGAFEEPRMATTGDRQHVG